jgi:3'-5' exoribonuclease
MANRPVSVVPLHELADGQEADLFVLLAHKEECRTRDGKPYWRVTFRDAKRTVTFPLWAESPLATECRETWTAGDCYKLRAVLRNTTFGPQLDIKKIRLATDDDRADGYDPLAFVPQSRFSISEMYESLLALVRTEITTRELADLVLAILTQHRVLLHDVAGGTHHHDFRGGLLEHTLSVARNAVLLADKYRELYPHVFTAEARDVAIAAAVLHDMGKLEELSTSAAGTEFTAVGELVGHIVLSRDLIRAEAAKHRLPGGLLLRLEHAVLAHQGTAEWGSPKRPMTLEALIVYYAAELDARFQMMVEAIERDTSDGPLTGKQNALKQRVYRGPTGERSD